MLIASLRDNIPSTWSLVDAPVKIFTLKGRPAACSAAALTATASNIALGLPGAVKPDNPRVSPWFIIAAASSGVI